MTRDYMLIHHPTDGLIISIRPRFFPFEIPNFHPQLRHYISTADADRIYIVAHKIIHSLHISSQKWDTIASIPFEPKCFTAGYGWIVVGGGDGECAFVRLSEQAVSIPFHEADVDTALPIDLDSNMRTPPVWTAEHPRSSNNLGRRQSSKVKIKELGRAIVNSVTIHRLPGDGNGFADEDIIILSNNDHTVKIWSLTRWKILQTICHPVCMNYAAISPDSKILVAVGDVNVSDRDVNKAYFYGIIRETNTTVEYGDSRLAGWKWTLLCCLELQSCARPDDGSCFTVAFSPSSHLCAVGSQAGIITIFDMDIIRQWSNEEPDRDPQLCMFRSSRPDSSVGAVRSMSFSPDPWDILVWVEDTGRAGIADVRQGFLRRQILNLDMDDPDLQKVRTSFAAPSGESEYGNDDLTLRSSEEVGTIQQTMDELLEGSPLSGQATGGSDLLHESLVQDLTERERQILEFLNTTRWTSRQDEGSDNGVPRATIHFSSASNPNPLGSADVPNRTSRTTSPLRPREALHELLRENYLGRSLNPRRQASVVLSQSTTGVNSQTPDTGNSATTELQIHRLTASPSNMQPSDPFPSNDLGAAPDDTLDASDLETDNRQVTLGRASALTNTSFPSATAVSLEDRPRSQRSRSIPRRSERPVGSATESRYDSQLVTSSELRANVGGERLRRQRLAVNEIRSPRWIRNVLNDLPDQSLGHLHQERRYSRAQQSGGTAGVGWSADGRNLYIGTVNGIFEYQLNVQDRKFFPVLACR